MPIKESLKQYLESTEFIDSDNVKITSFVSDVIGIEKDKKKAILKLFYRIRDGIPYSFNSIKIGRETFIASNVIDTDNSFCIPKAILLTAVARAIGIPSRLVFADVKNHLASTKILEKLKTDLFVFHGYTELWLNEKWVKATPAFNKELCMKFNVKPLDFDGENDSIFQEFTVSGDKYMNYIVAHGHFADFPFELMINSFYNAYPHLYNELSNND